jgi:cytochrome b6-f complex iron-sulfur subunit
LDEQTRREFCGHACRAASAAGWAAALGSILQACGGGGSPTSASGGSTSAGSAPTLPTISGTVAGGAITVNVGSGSPLASVGGAALLQTSSGVFLVARTGQETFSALTATCTHEACTITGFSNQRYVCPCHGSSFDTSGRVLTGPAVTALRQFQNRFANGVLTITL